MLLRFAYLNVTNVFTLLRLLPVSDRDKNVEILVLRYQITVLQRQLGTTGLRLLPSDRAFLAALLHLWVPTISSTSRDQAIFVDHATGASLPSYAVLAENDRLW